MELLKESSQFESEKSFDRFDGEWRLEESCSVKAFERLLSHCEDKFERFTIHYLCKVSSCWIGVQPKS